MANKNDIQRFRDNVQGELDAAATYRTLASLETRPEIQEVYNRMAAMEEKHVAFWTEQLKTVGESAIPQRPTLRARVLIWIARKGGPAMILPTLVAGEQRAGHGYDNQPEVASSAMPSEEQAHARVLAAVSKTSPGVEGNMLARIEGRHRAVGGNALRAAVLGANDGLVSTLSLVMGVAGGSQDARTVALAGVAGMLAGACAMAMGEWLSVQSARELAQKQLAIEEAELNQSPQEEMEELALIYQSKGLPQEEAQSLASRLISDKSTALDTLAREELGLDPEELGGNAWEAAIASFVLFFIGALAPAVPFLLVHTIHAGIVLSLCCSAVALLLLGFMTHVMTGRGLWFSGVRALIIGMLAAGVTYGMGVVVGHLFGIQVAG